MDVINSMFKKAKIKIGNRLIGDFEPVFIIAEAGVNHNGDKKLAKRLIDLAAQSGADAVKFQTFHAENVVTKDAEKATYQKSTTASNESQFEMIKKLELPDTAFSELAAYAKKRGIIFLSTPFDLESVDLLEQVGVPAYKIPSGEITNFSIIKKIARKKRPVILSTGMASLGEVEDAFSCLHENGCNNIVLLHCTSSYPAPLHSVNLSAMIAMRSAFHVPVGYSDHTEGITIPIAAAAMGACVIEKHFTLDKSLPGPDHKASLNPDELKAMVQAVRDVEIARGSGIKALHKDEVEIRKVARRSIVASRDIQAKEILTERDFAIKRPGTGIEPRHLSSLLQKRARMNIKKDQLIHWHMIE